MQDTTKKRAEIISLLESALGLANDLNQGVLSYLVERAIDEARSFDFRRPE